MLTDWHLLILSLLHRSLVESSTVFEKKLHLALVELVELRRNLLALDVHVRVHVWMHSIGHHRVAFHVS